MRCIVCRLTLATALAVMLPLGAALAGTPFGGDDTGFVPPNKDVAKCEDTAAKITAKDLGCLIKCEIKAVVPTLRGKPPLDDEPCEGKCAAATIKATTALYAKNICPPCITQVSPSDVAAGDEQTVDASTAIVGCAGTTPRGGDDPGNVPPDKAIGKCEFGAATSSARLVGAIYKCHIKAADAAFKNKQFDEEACEDTAAGKYTAATGKLTGCDPCLDLAGLGTLIRNGLDQGNGGFYCASPSGAFVDALNY